MRKYVLLRFYGGGGLARSKVVTCEEEDLIDKLATFEQDCVNDNVGEYNAVLDEEELKRLVAENE